MAAVSPEKKSSALFRDSTASFGTARVRSIVTEWSFWAADSAPHVLWPRIRSAVRRRIHMANETTPDETAGPLPEDVRENKQEEQAVTRTAGSSGTGIAAG